MALQEHENNEISQLATKIIKVVSDGDAVCDAVAASPVAAQSALSLAPLEAVPVTETVSAAQVSATDNTAT